MWEEEVDHARAENVSKDSRSHGRWWTERQTGDCGRVVFRLLVDGGVGRRWGAVDAQI